MKSQPPSLARLAVAVLVALSVPVVPAAASAPAPAPLPQLAGTTILTFDGASAVRLHVPKDLKLLRENVTMKVDKGRAAFGFLGPLSTNCRAGFESQADSPNPWCTDISFEAMEGWALSPNVSMNNEQAFGAGPAEFHMVTDGAVTVTIKAPELEGTRRYNASGRIEADLKETPVSCAPVMGCIQGLGRNVFRNVPGSSIVGSAAFGQRPNNIPATGDPSPGSASAASCIYPNEYNPEKSPAAEDHPTGCDADEFGPGTWKGRYVTGLNPLIVSIATLGADYADAPRPAVYTGYVAHQAESTELLGEPAGRFGGWSYWLNRPITCPSGNFHAC